MESAQVLKGGKGFRIAASINPSEWINYFRTLLTLLSDLSPTHYAMPYFGVETLDGVIKVTEVELVIRKLKDRKAPGEDRISAEFYKNAPLDYLELIFELFNTIYEGGKVPSSFMRSIIFPLHKRGDLNIVSNYRGISFIDCIAKIFSGVLLARLEKWVLENSVLKENQAGFRKQYSAADNIFVLFNIIKYKLREKRKVYCFFIDFKSAFDNIDRNALFCKLSMMGVSYKFIRALMNLYHNTNSAIWINGSLSERFKTVSGGETGLSTVSSGLLFVSE